MIVTIDGPSGVGKSSVARYCAETLAIKYINSGEYYRAITHYAISHMPHQSLKSPDAIDSSQVTHIAHQLVANSIEDYIHMQAAKTEYNDLYSVEVDTWVSYFSAIPSIRTLVNNTIYQQSYFNVIIEGRDIGTHVYPEAELKIYLRASIKERTKRRSTQRKNSNLTQEYQIIKARDTLDSSRAHSPLSIASDAHVIDTTHLAFAQVCKIVLKLISSKLN